MSSTTSISGFIQSGTPGNQKMCNQKSLVLFRVLIRMKVSKASISVMDVLPAMLELSGVRPKCC
ncbi:MAG: hypothetical protein U0176_08380 [Bacteroidia bacterium]